MGWGPASGLGPRGPSLSLQSLTGLQDSHSDVCQVNDAVAPDRSTVYAGRVRQAVRVEAFGWTLIRCTRHLDRNVTSHRVTDGNLLHKVGINLIRSPALNLLFWVEVVGGRQICD